MKKAGIISIVAGTAAVTAAVPLGIVLAQMVSKNASINDKVKNRWSEIEEQLASAFAGFDIRSDNDRDNTDIAYQTAKDEYDKRKISMNNFLGDPSNVNLPSMSDGTNPISVALQQMNEHFVMHSENDKDSSVPAQVDKAITQIVNSALNITYDNTNKTVSLTQKSINGERFNVYWSISHTGNGNWNTLDPNFKYISEKTGTDAYSYNELNLRNLFITKIDHIGADGSKTSFEPNIPVFLNLNHIPKTPEEKKEAAAKMVDGYSDTARAKLIVDTYSKYVDSPSTFVVPNDFTDSEWRTQVELIESNKHFYNQNSAAASLDGNAWKNYVDSIPPFKQARALISKIRNNDKAYEIEKDLYKLQAMFTKPVMAGEKMDTTSDIFKTLKERFTLSSDSKKLLALEMPGASDYEIMTEAISRTNWFYWTQQVLQKGFGFYSLISKDSTLKANFDTAFSQLNDMLSINITNTTGQGSIGIADILKNDKKIIQNYTADSAIQTNKISLLENATEIIRVNSVMENSMDWLDMPDFALAYDKEQFMSVVRKYNIDLDTLVMKIADPSFDGNAKSSKEFNIVFSTTAQDIYDDSLESEPYQADKWFGNEKITQELLEENPFNDYRVSGWDLFGKVESDKDATGPKIININDENGDQKFNIVQHLTSETKIVFQMGINHSIDGRNFQNNQRRIPHIFQIGDMGELYEI